jgi:hypothetical protein
MIKHRISNTECRMSKGCVLPLAYPINCLCGSIRTRKNSGFQTVKNFQHVSAGPQPIFGLAEGLRGLGAARMKHAGPWREAMKCAMT